MSIDVSQEGRVRRIVLNRPEKRNALNSAMSRDLARAFHDTEGDTAVGAILLSATGPAFCAGMDLQEVVESVPVELAELHERIFTSIQRSFKPVIAAVHGAALGGGTGLAANAHIVVASPDAKFGLTEIRVGLWPVLVFRAVSLAVGERRATELSLTGRIFGAQEAIQYGLVTEIAENPGERAGQMAAAVAEQSAAAMSAGLAYVRQIRGVDWENAGKMGVEVRDRLMTTSEFRTGVERFLSR